MVDRNLALGTFFLHVSLWTILTGVIFIFVIGMFIAWVVRKGFGTQTEKAAAVIDALAMTCGAVGAILFAVGIIPLPGGALGYSGDSYVVVVLNGYMLVSGLWLIVMALGTQVPKVATNLRGAFRRGV